MFSQIDPYVVVRFNGNVVGRTLTRDNEPNPRWDEDFFFEVEAGQDGGLTGTVTLELYDEEVRALRLSVREGAARAGREGAERWPAAPEASCGLGRGRRGPGAA